LEKERKKKKEKKNLLEPILLSKGQSPLART